MIFKKHIATNLSEYIEIIEEIYNDYNYFEELWFRGQPDASYRLVPAGLRNLKEVINARGYTVKEGEYGSSSYGGIMAGPRIDCMFEEFKRKAQPLLDYKANNDFEWLFIAQHYGIQTRLLDWSNSPLIALYFATRGEFKCTKSTEEEMEAFNQDELSGDGCAVFVIDPAEINETFVDKRKIIDVIKDYAEWKPYLNPMNNGAFTYTPICIKGYHIDKRIQSQKGNFTLHGSNIWAIDYYTVIEQKIHKIFIPNSCVYLIRKQLKDMGITNYFVFPDLNNLCRDIVEREQELYVLANKYDKLPKGYD